MGGGKGSCRDGGRLGRYEVTPARADRTPARRVTGTAVQVRPRTGGGRVTQPTAVHGTGGGRSHEVPAGHRRLAPSDLADHRRRHTQAAAPGPRRSSGPDGRSRVGP
ncbi:hypothetical protein GCM10010251_85820 [Streptomyces aurantiogriseus]|uniref:Uncharacterized protein n=1 Tax=Streptomyces aurantiogriseus TaxID=66870 RepID=A0A918FMG0_9ACTN|nr:hypothetical protein GCM10010251_85820 [Streptomyces aurantiogriseus]